LWYVVEVDGASGGRPHFPSADDIESARAAARTRDSYFCAQYRQVARRRGPNKAAVAVAHSLLDVIWRMLTTGEVFADLGADYFTSRHDEEHQTLRLVSQLEKLGYTVELIPTA
jgi:transposase